MHFRHFNEGLQKKEEKDILPSSDYVIDGTKDLEDEVEEIMQIILAL